MSLIDPIGYDPHPSDEEWAALTCDLCGGQPVTLCAGMCSHYCDDHGPDDEDTDRENGSAGYEVLGAVPDREIRHEDWCHTVTGCTEPHHCTCEAGASNV